MDTAPTKQSYKAVKRVQAPAALQHDFVDIEEDYNCDEALSGPLQGMANRMDNMIAMILELSQNKCMARIMEWQSRCALLSPVLQDPRW